MFNWFKKKKERKEQDKQTNEYSFVWYDLGPENPFNKRILDIRSFTATILATTSDESIAKKYNQLRNSIGDDPYIGANPIQQDSIIDSEGGKSGPCEDQLIQDSHNGA